MFFGWFLRCPRLRTDESNVSNTSQDPTSIDVYTIDNSCTVTRCTVDACNLPQNDITSAETIRNFNRVDFKQLYGKMTECPAIKTSHFGIYMAALCMEILVFVGCILYTIVEVCSGHRSAAGALASLGILMLIASFPSFLSMLAGSAPLILFSVATHFLSSLLLMALSVEAYAIWNSFKFSTSIREVLPVVIIVAIVQAFVAGSSLTYYFKWLSEIGKPTLIVEQPESSDKTDGSNETENSTSAIQQEHYSSLEKSDDPKYGNDKGLNNEKNRIFGSNTDSKSDNPQFETAAISLTSLRSYPYDERDRRASAGQETYGAHFGGRSTDFESVYRDSDQEIAPYENWCVEKVSVPDSVYCDNSFVESATPQSVYCVTGPSRVTGDGYDSFNRVIRHHGEVENSENAPRKKLVYFASLQPEDALRDLNIPRYDKVNPLGATLNTTMQSTIAKSTLKMTAKELVAQMPRTRI